ncbi:hypothetical protein like AT5G52430 [Hibiscus trionum]|uniref:Hydroxyproline-rich glycoprotein family protein n=1 Tax=Hibiscus trionum TaxID=183268 RepID=A0A9W7H5X1_HIBTR|nr:hypothetical protein like AT5G52430 [Hibiscus trionum]
MRSVNDSVETINAAASAIVSAESRVQPTTVQKKRWGSCWCFGYHKTSKRIGHAVLVPEPVVPGAAVAAAQNASIPMPFIVPPSSPASFPPSATHSPAGLLSLSVNAYSPRGPPSIFAIGPYAHETQLVTPPVFSALPTEPSTAPFTPPPESVQITTPSSPEVPFAQLLTSSLERARRNSGINQKFGLSRYEFQSHQTYPGSPGSAISNSGTSSPFPDKRTPKILGIEHFTTCKWGSRLGSGSLTPDGLGQGSRLGSGCVTPDGMGLDSGSMTPDGFRAQNLVSKAALFANPSSEPKRDEAIVDHRVSFELSGEDVARCLESKSFASNRTMLVAEGRSRDILSEEEHCYQKHRSVTLGSIKEFNFDNAKGEASDKPSTVSEWWANEKVAGKEAKPGNNWTLFPMLQS